MLPEVGVAGSQEVAERIRERVSRESINRKGDRVTVSIGIAMFPEQGDTPEDLFQQADHALYAAKAAGRNRVVTATGQDPSHQEEKPIRLIPKEKRKNVT
jgi:diguanylate cyclase (GGDEF)-like protein